MPKALPRAYPASKGTEAMASRSGSALSRLSQLWQLPLLLVSLGLFGYAAYLFINPNPRLTVSQRIDAAETNLKYGRHEAALEQCNKLLATDTLKPEDESHLHLLIAQIIEGAQKEHHLNLPANNERIVEQTREGLARGGQPTWDTYRRLAESCEALGRSTEALAAYRRAMALEPNRSLPLQRKVIELQLLQDDTAPAAASIEEYLKSPAVADAERGWALEQKAQVLIKKEQYAAARPVIESALILDPEPTPQGVGRYWLGYCTWKLADAKEAERILRVARDQMKVSHPLDAEAAYVLGLIREAANDPKEAISFFQVVLSSHPESRPAPLARLHRGLCRITQDEDLAGLTDVHDFVGEIGAKKSRESLKNEAIEGLKQAAAALAAKKNFTGAIEVLEDEQTLVPEPPPDYFSRLASVMERRADQVEQGAPVGAGAADNVKREQQVRKLRTEAGDAYIALSRGLTLTDDHGQGEAMWKGVNLYDKAGATQQSIAAMELFVAERPNDSQTPDALLRLGMAYQATGQYDKAIKRFQQNQFRYPQSLAAIRSGVPLAQAYIAKGSESYPKAEKVLLGVLENNPVLTPDSLEFRQSLFELAQLYYRTGRYEDAIARLEETTQRYPSDPRMGQLVFLMGDSYRKSAALLTAAMTPPTPPPAGPLAQPASAKVAANGANTGDALAAASARAEAAAARHDRLLKAKAMFDRAVDLARTAPPKDDLDRLYLKLSHFYRADCLYDLGQYEEAIRLYDAATLRYQDDPTAVAAYVQIVNAYCALGRFEDARTANERAKWLLRRMPPEAFNDGKFSMPKQYWDDWLRFTGESGLYQKDVKRASVSDASR